MTATTTRAYRTDVADLEGAERAAYQAAAAAALAKHKIRGYYADAVACGSQRLSGADLKGNAKKYGMSYARIRGRVLKALVAEGVAFEAVGPHNRRYLTPGRDPNSAAAIRSVLTPMIRCV